jgi:hypothetical protein
LAFYPDRKWPRNLIRKPDIHLLGAFTFMFSSSNRTNCLFLCCVLLLVATHAAAAQSASNAWNGLVPLGSTRADVEQLLGTPKMSHGLVYTYETKDDRVDVLYSAGPCALSGVEKWNVPSDVVISMQVNPKQTILIDSLHLDAKKYVRFREAHPDNWVQYWNEADGTFVHTIFYGKNEELYFTEYRPTTKQKTLRCPD